jgi:2-dehydropantoate 2-reductase
VTAACFPDSSSRPQYLAGIVNQGVYKLSTFSSVHAAKAPVTIGQVPQYLTGPPASEPCYLAQLVVDTAALDATYVQPAELLLAQLIKLAINSVINPLTVIFACVNGELLKHPVRMDVQRKLLEEIAPMLQGIWSDNSSDASMEQKSAAMTKLSFQGLSVIVNDINIKVAKNTSSMRQDVAAGRRTEIDYMNGYLVEKAKSLGLDIPLNEKIVDMVKKTRAIDDDQAEKIFLR